MIFKGKRLLILAGAGVHTKLVKAAQELGVYTIVTDNVPTSYAKKIADKAYDVNVFDMVGLEAICRKEHVDGVIACYIDICQRPYNDLCERMGFYCYGTKEQFFKMTDKHAFKKMCIDNGVDVITEYSESDLDSIEYPVFVKPVDNRGSRGQSVCYTREELVRAIEFAKSESSNGDILIEKYMKGAHEFQVTYFFKDGEAYLLRTVDSYCGSEERHLEKIVACAVSPSRFTDLYLKTAHKKVIKMFKKLGFKNGPIFMQGFEDNGVFRFFDPGLRFPGVDYELIYKEVYDADIMKAMICFALTGVCGDIELPKDGVFLKEKRAAVLFPTIKAGVIGRKEGEDQISGLGEVVSYLPRWNIGGNVPWSYNVNQRSAEIDILCNDTERLKKLIDQIQSVYRLIDQDGNDMTYELFDTERII